MKIDTGIEPAARERVAQSLSGMLADTYTTYLKTHNYHWNVTGPMFDTLHKMFEVQYNELWLAVDELAERIRALGHPAPGSYASFGKLAKVKDAGDGTPAAKEMIGQLVQDHETVVRTAREVLRVSEDAGDDVTADMVTGRMRVHEKTAWMLRSLLE